MAGGGETHSDITRFSKASPVHYFLLDMTSYLFYDMSMLKKLSQY